MSIESEEELWRSKYWDCVYALQELIDNGDTTVESVIEELENDLHA